MKGCWQAPAARLIFPSYQYHQAGNHGGSAMTGQVILYFDDQADALRFALAAGQVMAGEGEKFASDLVQETARASRIRLDAEYAGHIKEPSPDCAA